MAAVRDGSAETLTFDEMRGLLASPTPLVVWRKQRGKTQPALAHEVGVSQDFIAEIQAAKKTGDVRLPRNLATELGVTMEGLAKE